MKLPSLSIESLARSCGQRPWLTIGIWSAVVLVCLLAISAFLGDALTSDITFTNNPESKRGRDLIEERLRSETQANELVIVRSTELTVDSPRFREVVEPLYADILTLIPKGIVDASANYYVTRDETLVSADRMTTIIPVIMAGDTDTAEDTISKLKDVVHSHNRQDDFQIVITGDASLGDDWLKAAQADLETAEILGLPIALLVLILVFGAISAALIPLLLGVIAIIMAVGITALVGQAHEFSVFITNMIAAMGFALGIDYSLFIISRYREERRGGKEKMDAIISTSATASRAVFFSGMTVVLALIGMLIVPISLFTSLAVGAILVAIAAVMVTLTLLPAILSIAGDRINSLQIPMPGHWPAGPERSREGGFWDTLSRTVMRRPVISLLIATGLLVAAIIPISSFHLGASGISSFPDDLESKQGFTILEEDFSFGLLNPARIVIDGNIDSAPVHNAINTLTTAIKADPAFYATPILEINSAGNLAELAATIGGDPTDDQAIDAIRRLRDDYIPQAFADVDADVLVTGETAFNLDYIDITDQYLPIVFIFVLALSFILLTIVFRSIVVPIKAILMNLLSVGATYGLVVLVFQKGFGAGILGFQELDKFEAWVPIFLFCMLFGLSMDYHVFLLSRIRERFDQTQSNTESVAFGIRTTGGIITGAALIMMAVFAGFAAGDLVMFQQMGFGMAVAVFLDATIVRSILVPSAMRLLGKRNWYLPKSLEWLPQIHLRD